MWRKPKPPPSADSMFIASHDWGPGKTGTSDFYSAELDQALGQTLKASLIIIMAAALVVMAFNLLLYHNRLEIALDAVFVVSCALLYRFVVMRHRLATAAVLMLVLMLCMASSLVCAMGSIRAATAPLFVAVVVFAGVFMSGRVLWVTCLASCALIALVGTLEARGLMPAQPHMAVTHAFWVTQLATLTGIAALVYYGRLKKRQAIMRRLQAIEQRVQSEHERDRNQRRFTRIFRLAPVPLVVYAFDTGAIVDVNPAFESAYRYPRDAVLGRTDEFLWSVRQDRRTCVRRLRRFTRIENLQTLLRRADGSTVQAVVSFQIKQDAGQKLVIASLVEWSALSGPRPAPRPARVR